MEINYNELVEKMDNKENEIESENNGMNWKKMLFYFIIIVIIIGLSITLISLDNKPNVIDKINKKGQDIIKLENSLISNQIEQNTTYNELKKIQDKYNKLLSGEQIILKSIEDNRKQIKVLIK